MSLRIDMSKLKQSIHDLPNTFSSGAKRGMQDVLNDWRTQSIDKAPMESSTLRRNIKTELESNAKLNLSGKVSANAYNGSYKGQRFNYAYYIHEVKGKEFKGRTPGTIGDFLDQPAKRNNDRWMRHIENEIQSELKRKGW